jgi:hypothetical protein
MHDVATKELEYVQGYGDTYDEYELSNARGPRRTKDGCLVDTDALENIAEPPSTQP